MDDIENAPEDVKDAMAEIKRRVDTVNELIGPQCKARVVTGGYVALEFRPFPSTRDRLIAGLIPAPF